MNFSKGSYHELFKHFIKNYGVIYISIWVFGGAAYKIGKEAEAGRGTLMSNLCLISRTCYAEEKLRGVQQKKR